MLKLSEYLAEKGVDTEQLAQALWNYIYDLTYKEPTLDDHIEDQLQLEDCKHLFKLLTGSPWQPL